MARFYKKDLTFIVSGGRTLVKKDILHFYMCRPSLERSAIPFEFDGVAEAKHVKEYATEYQEYLRKVDTVNDVKPAVKVWPTIKLRMLNKLFSRK